jgi:hypothetical protein
MALGNQRAWRRVRIQLDRRRAAWAVVTRSRIAPRLCQALRRPVKGIFEEYYTTRAIAARPLREFSLRFASANNSC